jgi:tetratricopeptide (TPR) repeat protein
LESLNRDNEVETIFNQLINKADELTKPDLLKKKAIFLKNTGKYQQAIEVFDLALDKALSDCDTSNILAEQEESFKKLGRNSEVVLRHQEKHRQKLKLTKYAPKLTKYALKLTKYPDVQKFPEQDFIKKILNKINTEINADQYHNAYESLEIILRHQEKHRQKEWLEIVSRHQKKYGQKLKLTNYNYYTPKLTKYALKLTKYPDVQKFPEKDFIKKSFNKINTEINADQYHKACESLEILIDHCQQNFFILPQLYAVYLKCLWSIGAYDKVLENASKAIFLDKSFAFIDQFPETDIRSYWLDHISLKVTEPDLVLPENEVQLTGDS